MRPRYQRSIHHYHSFVEVAADRHSSYPVVEGTAAVAGSTWVVGHTGAVVRKGLVHRIAADLQRHDRHSARRCFEVAEDSLEALRRVRPIVVLVRHYAATDPTHATDLLAARDRGLVDVHISAT
jgi:hypothetical protein